jgi:hypothetical protein
MEPEQEIDDEEVKRVMGFSEFGSTKYKDHTASAVEAVFKPNLRKFTSKSSKKGPKPDK